jgi:hypothetical protein
VNFCYLCKVETRKEIVSGFQDLTVIEKQQFLSSAALQVLARINIQIIHLKRLVLKTIKKRRLICGTKVQASTARSRNITFLTFKVFNVAAGYSLTSSLVFT